MTNDLINAVRAAEAHDVITALGHFVRAEKTQNPKDVWFNFGIFLQKRGDVGAAIEAFESCLANDQYFLPAVVALAELFIQSKQLNHCTHLLQLHASALDAFTCARLTAKCAIKAQSPEAALAQLDAYFNHQHSQTLATQGYIAVNEPLPPEIQQQLESQPTALNATELCVLYNLYGQAFEENRQFSAAYASYLVAANFQPEQTTALRNAFEVARRDRQFEICEQIKGFLEHKYDESPDWLPGAWCYVLHQQGQLTIDEINSLYQFVLNRPQLMTHTVFGLSAVVELYFQLFYHSAYEPTSDYPALCELHQSLLFTPGSHSQFSDKTNVLRLIVAFASNQMTAVTDAVHSGLINIDALDNNSKRYYEYLVELLKWQATYHITSQDNEPQAVAHLETSQAFVVGDSHALGFKAANPSVTVKMIQGIKLYHLAIPQANQYQQSLTHFIDSFAQMKIESDRVVKLYFSIGEIDCRHDEGILPHMLKTHSKVTAEGVEASVDNCVTKGVRFIANLIAESPVNFEVYFLQVPLPSLAVKKSLTNSRYKQLKRLINEFNAQLFSESHLHGFMVQGIVCDKQSHVDAYHLNPSCYVNPNH